MHKDDIKKERARVVEELHIGDLTLAEQDDLLEQLGELAFKRTLVAVLELLDEADRSRFEEYLQTGNQEDLQEMLVEKIGKEKLQAISETEIWNVIQDHKKTVAELTAETA